MTTTTQQQEWFQRLYIRSANHHEHHDIDYIMRGIVRDIHSIQKDYALYSKISHQSKDWPTLAADLKDSLADLTLLVLGLASKLGMSSVDAQIAISNYYNRTIGNTNGQQLVIF